jgi:hypothetical protein
MNDSIRLKFYATIVHPLITIFVPFWFLATLLLVFVNSLVIPAGHVVFPPMYFVLMLLVGMSETITGNMLYKERIASILPRLREFVFVVGFGILLILLFHGDIARRDFSVGRIKIWLPTVFLGVQWFLSYFIHQRLREREMFLRFFVDKDPKQTREIYNSYMHEGSASLKAIDAVKRLLIALMCIGFVGFVLTSWILRIQYTGLALFMILSLFVVFALIIAMLNIWHEAQFIMMDGHIVPRNQRRFRLAVAVLLLIVALLMIIPFTGSDSYLPESYLASFFKWLENIGRFEPPDREADAPKFKFDAPDMRVDNYLGDFEGGESNAVDLSGVTRIIGWTVLGLLLAGVLAFLLLPLFRGVRGGFSPREGLKKIGAALRRTIDSVVVSVNAFLGELSKRKKSRGWDKIKSQGKTARQEAMARRAQRTALRRRERKVSGRMLRAFFRFTKWGEKRGVSFTFTVAPLEYARKVAAESPEHSNDCNEIAQIFEEAVYSNHEIGESQRSAFISKIRTITKSR